MLYAIIKETENRKSSFFFAGGQIMRKLVMALGAAAVISAVCTAAAYAGTWQSDNSGKYWYLKDDGGYYAGNMFNIDGVNYCFDSSGYMLTGWQQPVKFGAWYYFEPSGIQAVGWKEIDGKWYYLDPTANGAMRTGWFTDEAGNLYYLDHSQGGAMRRNEMFTAINKHGSELPNLYEATASGVILRNTTTTTSSGTEMEYMDDGAIRYRTSVGALSSANDSGWHWAHAISDIQEWKAIDDQSAKEEVDKVKDDLAERFESIKETSNKTRYREKIKAWEQRAKKELQPYVEKGYLTSSDVSSFISRVIYDTYDLFTDDSDDYDDDFDYYED